MTPSRFARAVPFALGLVVALGHGRFDWQRSRSGSSAGVPPSEPSNTGD